MEYRYEDGYERMKLLIEINEDGKDVVSGKKKSKRIKKNVNEVGSERKINKDG